MRWSCSCLGCWREAECLGCWREAEPSARSFSSSVPFLKAAAADLWSDQALPEFCFPAVLVTCPLQLSKALPTCETTAWERHLRVSQFHLMSFPPCLFQGHDPLCQGDKLVGLCLVWGVPLNREGPAQQPCLSPPLVPNSLAAHSHKSPEGAQGDQRRGLRWEQESCLHP